jgi:hypothetical protein
MNYQRIVEVAAMGLSADPPGDEAFIAARQKLGRGEDSLMVAAMMLLQGRSYVITTNGPEGYRGLAAYMGVRVTEGEQVMGNTEEGQKVKPMSFPNYTVMRLDPPHSRENNESDIGIDNAGRILAIKLKRVPVKKSA